MDKKHYILIGFKHAGKTTVGANLAAVLKKPFYDLDRWIENYYAKNLNCREIMLEQGEIFFRQLESYCLQQVLQQHSSVIALGGGTLLNPEHHKLIGPHVCIYITAQPKIMYSRIKSHGTPTFLRTYPQFLKILNERRKTYEQMAHVTIDNSGELNETLMGLMQKIME